MSVTIQIPTPLRRFTANKEEVAVSAKTVGDALANLVEQHPSVGRHLYGEDGKLRSFVNIFLNDEDVRFLDREATALEAGDTLTIIPSIAGGAAP